MASFATKLNPSLAKAGKEFAFLGISLVGSATAVGLVESCREDRLSDRLEAARKHLLDDSKSLSNDCARHWKKCRKLDEEINQRLAEQCITEKATAIAIYAGLAKLLANGPTLPRFTARPPLSPPFAALAAVVAFVAGPLANLATSPLQSSIGDATVQLCTKLTEETTMDAPSDTPQAKTQEASVSQGTLLAPSMEAAVPGSVTLFVPVAEEILFRGLFFARLVPSLGLLPASLCSSVAFGVIHRGAEPSLHYVPVAETLIGLATSAVYYAAGGRLLVPVAFHSGVNAFSTMMQSLVSCPGSLARRMILEEVPQSEVNQTIAQLSFWERQIASQYVIICKTLCRVLEATQLVADAEAPFLPLSDDCGSQKQVSKSSIFFDNKTNAMVQAPRFYADGSWTPMAEALIEFGYYMHLSQDGMEPWKCLWNMASREQWFHSMLDNEAFGCAGDWSKEYPDAVGHKLLHHPTGRVPLEDFKKDFQDAARMGLFAEVNRDLFCYYILYQMGKKGAYKLEPTNSVSAEDLQGYFDGFESNQVPQHLRKELDEWRAAVEKHGIGL